LDVDSVAGFCLTVFRRGNSRTIFETNTRELYNNNNKLSVRRLTRSRRRRRRRWESSGRGRVSESPNRSAVLAAGDSSLITLFISFNGAMPFFTQVRKNNLRLTNLHELEQ